MITLLFFVCIFFMNSLYSVDTVTMRVQHDMADEVQKIKIALVQMHNEPFLDTVLQTIARDITGIGQEKSGFLINTYQKTEKITKSWLQELHKQGYTLAIFCAVHDAILQWWVYDVACVTKVCTKKAALETHTAERIGHKIADALWNLLTGQEAIFSTKIAYCKELADGKGKKELCIQYPGSQQVTSLVQGKILAPRWNKDMQHPFIVYSQVTPSNMRLMSVTLNGKAAIVANFDGATMLPSFSSDGTKIVYCSSSQGKSQLYAFEQDSITGKGKIQQITRLEGNVISPILRDNGDIIFCSDHELKSPQIYYLHVQTGNIERLSQGGYCAAPQLCEKTGTIAYSKLVGNTMQLFIYSLETKEHSQITFDEGDKDECCWSPEGAYIAFVYRQGTSSRIALLNTCSQERFFLTPAGQRCRYPSWSSYAF